MNKRTSILLSTTMASIATAACAFCVAQTANAAETSATTGVNTTVNSPANNSSTVTSSAASSNTATSSVAVTSSTAGSPSVTSSNVTSNTTNGGGAAFAKGSAKEVKTAEPKNTAEQGKDADSATTVQSTAIYAATSGVASNQPQTSAQQNAQSNSPASNNTTAEQDDMTWTRDDFNISADGKMIGGRKIVYHPDTGQTVDEYVDGLSAKGKEKLKRNHHLVIPEGIEVIHDCAFPGSATKVGNHHEHIDGETYIEGVTLPQSLKIIEYGAFGWNKIKGTVVIPKNVISIHNAAFIANEIDKVVFEGVIDGKGKEHDTDTAPYYAAGVGSVAFQGNKISEIVVKGDLSKYKLFPSNDPQKNDSVFDNQNPGPFTIEVGEEYKRPITITQGSGNHGIGVVEGFKENGIPVQIENSAYFKKNTAGKYVAIKPGTLQGQCLFYDMLNGGFRILGISYFTYNIIPKVAIHTVTFVNGDNANYASVQVKEGKSIKDKSVKDQKMPDNPKKSGFTFIMWNTSSDGTGSEFSASTSVKKNLTVYSIFKDYPPVITVQDKTITEGESLDLNSLVVSAKDTEDGDITSKVKLTDNGGFDNTKVGSYKITFSVTDNGGASATAAATVTVAKKPTPPTPPAPTPEPEPTPTPEPEPETEPVPDLFVPVEPIPQPIPVEPKPEPKSNPLPAPASVPTQPEQPNQQKQPEAKHAAKHLPETGSATTPILASAIASLFAGLAGFAESFAATRKRRN